MMKIEICGTSARCIQPMLLTAGLVGAQAEFTFDAAWDGLSRIAVFTDGLVTKDAVLGADNRCEIPHEVLTEAGRVLCVGVYGAAGDGTVVIPTVSAACGMVRIGAEPTGDESYPPTPDVAAQLLQRIEAVESSGGGGGTGGSGAVQSVNGKTGRVELTAEDVGAMAADAEIPEVPDKLPNPHKLTFSGAVSAEYDGSEAVEVVIPQGGSGGNSALTLLVNVTLDETTAGQGSYTFTESEYPGLANCKFLFAEVCLPASKSTGWVNLRANGAQICNYGGGNWLYLAMTAENVGGRWVSSSLADTNNAAGKSIPRGNLQAKYANGIISPVWAEFDAVAIVGNSFAPDAGTVIRIWGAK